jgi:PAS domain S-box-containing protein
LGAVYVDNRIRAGVFEQRERNLLTAFANQVAVAIANARLFQRIQTSLQEILQMKELTDNVFASIGSGVITTDANNLITTFNQAACQILEKEHDAVIGQPLNQVLEVAADLDEILQQAQQESNLIIETEFSVSKNRRVVANMKFSPLRDANLNTQGVAIVLDDLTQQRERDEMLNVMQRYLPPALIENIHSIAGLDLGGERREVTCIFAEAGSVGTFAKGLPPQQIMEMVNAYLATATEAIHTVQGVIDKYMGTDVMALFNSQLNPMEDHAARAVEAALLMREGFIQLYRKLGIDPNPHYYRIGVHTGVATLGNVGSIIRRDFTAIGDTINLSKRLQENAKYGQIIISEDTRQLLQNAPIRLVELEPLQVKGRQQHTRVYEIFRV